MMRDVAILKATASQPPDGPLAECLRILPNLIPDSLPALAVIKPNLCDNASWKTGVTTDPQWIPALATHLRRKRSDIQIKVVESDAISAYRSFRSCHETFDRLGYREVANNAGVELVNLSEADSWEIEVPGLPDALRIPALFFEEFFFISVANVKLHPYERFTGALKNNYGLLPQADRTGLHRHLAAVLLALDQLCQTDLAILDGRIGLEGQGPIIGRPKALGRIIIGNDALAVDQTACRIMGINPKRVPHLRHLSRCRTVTATVTVKGDATPEPFVVDDPDTSSLIIRKFAVRRFHNRLERFSLRATSWLFEAQRNPLGFCRRAAKRLLPRKSRD